MEIDYAWVVLCIPPRLNCKLRLFSVALRLTTIMISFSSGTYLASRSQPARRYGSKKFSRDSYDVNTRSQSKPAEDLRVLGPRLTASHHPFLQPRVRGYVEEAVLLNSFCLSRLSVHPEQYAL
jgi:hypothetical protein